MRTRKLTGPRYAAMISIATILTTGGIQAWAHDSAASGSTMRFRPPQMEQGGAEAGLPGTTMRFAGRRPATSSESARNRQPGTTLRFTAPRNHVSESDGRNAMASRVTIPTGAVE